jgi:hypothetical protein
LATSLCGCVTTEQGAVGLARAIPTQTCELILKAVPLPQATATTDARAAFIEDDAALLTANDRIRAGRHCIADIRTGYAAKRK